jgi:TolB-like protein/Tfp pilus assembly protein PilF
VIIDGDDIYGDGVNIAARLEALAEPGGICVSRVVRDQIRDKLPYPFEDMGEQSVKNIARPVRAFAMSAAAVASTPLVALHAQTGPARRSIIPGHTIIAASAVAVIGIGLAAWWAWPKGSAPTASVQATAAASPQITPAIASIPAPRLSFVVLPFANLPKDPDQEYFADGVTDDLTTDLSRISGSFVIARNTAFTYKGKPADVKQIGRELGIRYVIEGSVRRAGDQVQVNVQLIDAESGAHVWADGFDTSRANLAEAQSEITGRLARSLNLELVEAAGRRIEQEKAANPDARDLVMRGWAWWYRQASVANREEARGNFERALEIDPVSVDARIGIAMVLIANLPSGWSNAFQRDGARAEQLLLEALARDPNNSMAHTAMGQLRRVQNRLPESRIECETAIALDRNNALAINRLGTALMWLGEPEAGIPYIEKAIRLNPHDPNIEGYYWGLGMSHLLLGHVDEAIEFFTKARAANPRMYYVHFELAGAFGLKGDVDEAKASLAESLKLKPEINSLAALRAYVPWLTNPKGWALREKTANVGLRRAGLPEE